MSPDEAKERIAELNKEAALLRLQAENAEATHDRSDADLEVAKSLLEEREADLRHQQEAVARASRAETEATSDLYRSSPELGAAHDEMVRLHHRLGIPVPAERDLLKPDGEPYPPPPPAESDPAVIEQLRGELVIAQAHVERLLDDQKPLKEELDRRTAERKAAEELQKAAEDSVKEQQADIAEISGTA